MTTYKTQLTIALTLLVGGLAFLYFFTGVFGGTTIDVTITTNPNLEQGLVGHWTFDGPDIGVDKSGSGNYGILTNFTSSTTVPGVVGQALRFNGANNQCVNAGNASVLNNMSALSLSFWVNPTTGGALIWKSGGVNPGWRLTYDEGTAIDLIVDYDSVDLSSGFNVVGPGSTILNQWTHIIVTWDGSSNASNIHLYKNGEEVPVTTPQNGSTSRDDDSGGVMMIACRSDTGSPTSGKLDDVRVYNRVISASEIKRLYELGATTHIAETITTNSTLTQGLVGHWTFDGQDLINNVTDRSGQGNHGVLTNFTSTTSAPGVIGQALDFNGTNHYVLVDDANSLDIVSEGTICAWAYAQSLDTTDRMIMRKRRNYGMGIDTTDVEFFYVDPSANYETLNASVPSLNTWYHYCGVAEGSNATGLYVNGELVDSTAGSVVDVLNYGTALVIGAFDFTPNQAINAILDDVRIYSRALSPTEIKRLYDLGATTHIAETITTNPTLTQGLVGHWTFDGQDLKNNATDRSGQGNTGYLTNFTSTTTSPGKIGQALEFDGSNDVVEVLNSSSLVNLGAMTISAWINPGTTLAGPHEPIVGKGYGLPSTMVGGWHFGTENEGATPNSLRFDVEFGGQDMTVAAADYSITPNTWQHVVLVWNGSEIASDVKFYVNGLETGYDGSTNGTGSRTGDSGYSLLIGDHYSGVNRFSGQLDDVRIYNRALTASEIKRLYELGR